MSELRALAETHGVATRWYDIAGTEHHPPDETLEVVLDGLGVHVGQTNEALRLPLLARPDEAVCLPDVPPDVAYRLEMDDGSAVGGPVVDARTVRADAGSLLEGPLPLGLHRLVWDGGERFVLVAPERCLLPEDRDIDRVFGVSAQMYGLKSDRDSAIGDFADLAVAGRVAAAAGADLFGLSPLHALFMADARSRSPYSPSNRRFINPLFIAVPEAAERLGLPTNPTPGVAASGSDGLLDYATIGDAKRHALEALFVAFRERGGDPRFEDFRLKGGVPLERHARFEALHEFVLAKDRNAWAFWTWPDGLGDATSPAVQAFAEAHADRVAFFAFLQWLADLQLAEAHAACRDAGMAIGLYRDLAVGVTASGSMAWSDPKLVLRTLDIGAPPDPLGPDGQNWGLAPFAPTHLARTGYRPLLAALEANARHAGAVRIDHVLGFQRQFWIPQGKPAAQGTYVDFPFQVLSRICALVSHRRRCLVIGEDLGTVPEGFRERMGDAGMLSCRVMVFERDGDRFRPPHHYPRQAMASVVTHDLPTSVGFWQHRDVDWRADLGELDAHSRASAIAWREGEKDGMLAAMHDAGVDEADVMVALHRFLARSNSALVMVQLEDLASMVEQANLPGTVDQHPNWRRRLPEAVDKILQSPRALAILQALRDERPPQR
ncbi:MAG: 4-alpha-glucanotransferase [Pseudomonadota bacterium]